MMRKVGFTLIALFALVGSAVAAPMCTSGQNVLSAGFSCELGGLVFSNFAASAVGMGAPQIFLGAGTGLGANKVNLGFQTNFNQNIFGFRDILFTFRVTGVIGGIDLIMGGGGHRSIAEQACADANCSSEFGRIDLESPPGPVTGETRFAAAGLIFIRKNISLFGEVGNAATMSEFSQSFLTAIPEPLTALLIGSGLLALGLRRRRSPKP